MGELFVDDRYRGAHGIGRYAAEVLPRLRSAWRPLGLDGTPSSPRDSLRAVPVGADTVIYSPGYGAFVRAQRQILTVHDLIHLRQPFPARMKFLAYYNGPVRRAIKRAGVVLTVSDTSAQEIREWIDDDNVRVVNAGNGCSAAFRPTLQTEPSSQPYILFVGNMRSHKNFDVVLRALAHAPDVKVNAVVPRRERAEAEGSAARHGVASRVRWLHDIDDDRLADLYRGAAATVMPSTLEGFGLPALESIACGVPVLYWRGCAAVSEVVGDRGWALSSAHDAEEWAAALSTALSISRRVQPPGTAHDWDRTARVVSDVIESVLPTR